MKWISWIKSHYRTILLWSILLAFTPLFVEILFVANIVGVEVAFAFLLLIIKDIYARFRYRVQQAKEFLAGSYQIILNHPICQTNIYLFHSTLSVAVLFFSGSLAFSVLIWYPIILSAPYGNS